MFECWMDKPEDRPNFRNITEELIQIQKVDNELVV